jgi:hypothetical protein
LVISGQKPTHDPSLKHQVGLAASRKFAYVERALFTEHSVPVNSRWMVSNSPNISMFPTSTGTGVKQPLTRTTPFTRAVNELALVTTRSMAYNDQAQGIGGHGSINHAAHDFG